jgi:hypothetical protein
VVYAAHPSLPGADEITAVGGTVTVTAAEEDILFSTEMRPAVGEVLKETGENTA